MEIDRKGFTPLYIQFYNILKADIASRPPYTSLPPERVLCEMYGLDRVTVRKALSMLADEKLIERKQGRGTLILPPPVEKSENGNILFALYQGSGLADRMGEPFYARSIDALEQYLQKTEYRLLYSMIRPNDDLEQLCQRMSVQGIILAGNSDELLCNQKRVTVPLITYNHQVNGIPAVLVDNEGGAATAANTLLELGHKKIGFINAPGFLNAEKRLRQFTYVVHAAGLSQMPYLAQGDWTENGGYLAMQEFLEKSPDITAVFAGNDSMAIGAMRAIIERGLSIPEDISIIGFDDIAKSSLASPALTTLQVNTSAMAEAACMLLFHVMGHSTCSDINAIISAKLINRDSTGRAKH